jgi:putative photosynthetic complex assembly protein 2
LPDHLRYLGSFWRRRASGGFFLVSLASFTFLTVFLWGTAGMLAGTGRAIGIALLASLTTLGLLEHIMLALPIGMKKAAPHQRTPIVSGQVSE